MSDQNLVMQSEGLGLRLLNQSDRELFFFIEQDVITNQYIKVPKPEAEIEVFFTKLQAVWSEEDKDWHGMAVVDVETNKFLGMSFYRYRDKPSLIIEIGWKLHPIAAGRGVATTGARMLIKYLHAKYAVHKFVAHCDADNLASERIMQKLGMQKEGVFKSHFKIGETWRDEFAYGLVLEGA